MPPFAYYHNLSKPQQRIYDRSDAVRAVELPGAGDMMGAVRAVEAALAGEDRASTERAVRALVAQMLTALGVGPVTVKVLAARPSKDWGELHGLYEREEDGDATITVWMRTAQRKRVVAFRTFLRTVLHELGHHLDYDLLKLADSYHTHGFFRRESSLFSQLVGEREKKKKPEPAVATAPARRPRKPETLPLPFDT